MSRNATKPARPPLAEPAYHQGWYPLALSAEVTGERPIGRNFLGSRAVLYRDGEGRAVVQSAYCPHLGADLSCGDLAAGKLRCAFHHWSFDVEGRCVHLPTEDKIPPGARIGTYASAEAWGLVWAFTGPEALFPLPGVPRVTEGELVYRTERLGLAPFEAWLPTSNGLDFQHLRALHGMRIPGPDAIRVSDASIEYSLAFGASELHGLISGTNTFSVYRRDGDDVTFRLWSQTPERPGETQCYSVVGVLDPRPRTAEERAALERRLDGLTEYMARLRDEDYEVLRAIRFRQGVLVAADRHLAAYFDYVRRFPRAEALD